MGEGGPFVWTCRQMLNYLEIFEELGKIVLGESKALNERKPKGIGDGDDKLTSYLVGAYSHAKDSHRRTWKAHNKLWKD